MGGNALKDVSPTRRYLATEYHALVPEVLARAQTMVPNGRVAVIPAYGTKESFGDMDVLVELSEGSAYEFRQRIRSAFEADMLVPTAPA